MDNSDSTGNLGEDEANNALAQSIDSHLKKKSSASGPMNKMGRSKRRRIAKVRAIRLELEKFSSSSSLPSSPQNNNPEKMIPMSKYVLPGVLSKRESLSEENKKELIGQLGFLPNNSLCVAARGKFVQDRFINLNSSSGDAFKDSQPTVLKLYPLAVRDAYAGGKSDGRKFKSRQRGCFKKADDLDKNTDMIKEVGKCEVDKDINRKKCDTDTHHPSQKEKKRERRDWRTPDGANVIEPFPTIYWLTCPRLKAMVSYLECQSYVSKFEKRLAGSPEQIQNDFQSASQQYAIDRWNTLSTEDQLSVEQRGWKSSLDSSIRGVAGTPIARYKSIKCLHTHTAHYLSGETRNCIGKWTIDAIEELLSNGNMYTVKEEEKAEKLVI